VSVDACDYFRMTGNSKVISPQGLSELYHGAAEIRMRSCVPVLAFLKLVACKITCKNSGFRVFAVRRQSPATCKLLCVQQNPILTR